MGTIKRVLLVIASVATIFSSGVLVFLAFGPYTAYVADLLNNQLFALVVEVCLFLSIVCAIAMSTHVLLEHRGVVSFVHPADNVDIQIATGALTKTIKTAIEETGDLFVDTIEVKASTRHASEAIYVAYCVPIASRLVVEKTRMKSFSATQRRALKNQAWCSACNEAINRAQMRAQDLVGAPVARVVIKICPNKAYIQGGEGK